MNEELKYNYEKDVSIEPDALDLEWIFHPKNYAKWAELSASADKIVRDKKEELEKIYAEVDLEIRSSGEGSEKKLTENLIRAKIITDNRYIEAQISHNDAIYNSNICTAAVKSLDHKKTALENLVKLWAGSYFAGPREPRDITEKYQSQKKIAEQTRERLKEHNRGN